MTRIKADVVETTRDGDPATPSGVRIINLIVFCYRVSMPPTEESSLSTQSNRQKDSGEQPSVSVHIDKNNLLMAAESYREQLPFLFSSGHFNFCSRGYL